MLMHVPSYLPVNQYVGLDAYHKDFLVVQVLQVLAQIESGFKYSQNAVDALSQSWNHCLLATNTPSLLQDPFDQSVFSSQFLE
jgi:hypothetical protein